jgi:hypothetical protein
MTADQPRRAGPAYAHELPFDTSVAHIARVYDYWLGGVDHFPADAAFAERAIALNPDIVCTARSNRAFLARTVRYLAETAGIRQFLDIGTGIPTANNTHEVAQSVASSCRVVYVDHDPVVLSHARALLTTAPEGMTCYIDADLRDPEKILAGAAGTIDFSLPVAVMLIAVLHLIPDDGAYAAVRQLMDAIPPGSFLTISHPASDLDDGVMVTMASQLNDLIAQQARPRSRAEVARFFDGLELVEPGVVRVPGWRAASASEADAPSAMWGAVGRKRGE